MMASTLWVITILFITTHLCGECAGSCDDVEQSVGDLTNELETLRQQMGNLARQTMLQQLFVEERIRSDGDSGVKIVRGSSTGLPNYASTTHVGGSFNSIHDHSNYDRAIGMGEVIAVLNGVEFRTRHNDYRLVMPSTTSTAFNALEPVPFPEVPEEVTKLEDINEQIEEMRTWFKAFKDQNITLRDYRKYFKPVLCYLEGAWTLDKDLKEPFESDRHKIDASSWFELQELVRYSSYTGTKSRLENYAFLPTTIMDVNATSGVPTFAQWNYRILCYPVGMDIPTKFMKQVDDLSYRIPRGKTLEQTTDARAARFKFFEHDNPRFVKYGLLDEIFYKIPGKDNIPGKLSQAAFGERMLNMGKKGGELNTGYYHRWFKFSKPGAMGQTTVGRGYNDENLWVAQNTQGRVAPIALKHCVKKWVSGKNRQEVCENYYTRFSYAIPLELIYLTPLLTWNPLKLYRQEKGYAATDGRNGGTTPEKAYNGTDVGHHYLTPVAFFRGNAGSLDPADTVKKSVGVLDTEGNVRATTASGTRIMLPDIEGVGNVRLRYPIAPVHGEGSSVWKELNAFKDTIFSTISDMQTPGSDSGEKPPTTIEFRMSRTYRDPPGEHFHEFDVSYKDFIHMVRTLEIMTFTTSEAAGHTHDIIIKYMGFKKKFQYIKCDGLGTCKDRHPRNLVILTESPYTKV